ncbi:hypothetical protein [Bacillus sp. Marseille-P3661]|uniref:hypothetical protein n=1 Tax=Bacillus sp. Marseille-P3661 TaxID=1936234 RepID=UPI000C8498F4|nr:hypothetical protein [Bacillus sp. Marseille-P3661]
MIEVKSVKIDGENVHLFNSAIYIFQSSTGNTLELDMIVSEVVVNKYRNEENLIVEIELQDGRVINTYMHVKSLTGGLPQLNLFSELEDSDDYQDFYRVHENDLSFPSIEEGITIEEIRQYEMPDEKITLKLNLPIAQTEWLKQYKNKELTGILKEAIYDYWSKNNIKK